MVKKDLIKKVTTLILIATFSTMSITACGSNKKVDNQQSQTQTQETNKESQVESESQRETKEENLQQPQSATQPVTQPVTQPQTQAPTQAPTSKPAEKETETERVISILQTTSYIPDFNEEKKLPINQYYGTMWISGTLLYKPLRVAHYNTEDNGANIYDIVKNNHTAWINDWHIPILVDSRHNGFELTKTAVPGETYVYVKRCDNQTMVLKCVKNILCNKTEDGKILDKEGKEVFSVDNPDLAGNRIMMYCNSFFVNEPTVTIWEVTER